MKKSGLAVVPLDLYARPIGSDDRALIGRAVMPNDALAAFDCLDSPGVISHQHAALPQSPTYRRSETNAGSIKIGPSPAFEPYWAVSRSPLRRKVLD